jgi:hypothetical protein
LSIPDFSSSGLSQLQEPSWQCFDSILMSLYLISESPHHETIRSVTHLVIVAALAVLLAFLFAVAQAPEVDRPTIPTEMHRRP